MDFKPKDAATRQVLDSVRHIVRMLRVSSRAAERELGLSAAQLFVLQKLAEAGEASINELAKRTLTHQSSVSVVVSRMVAKGLVRSGRSESDRRRAVLSLTPAGRALLRKAPAASQGRLIDAIQELGVTEQQKLARLLGKVIARSGIGPEPAEMFFNEQDH